MYNEIIINTGIFIGTIIGVYLGYWFRNSCSQNETEAYRSQIKILESLLNQHANMVAQLVNVKNHTQEYISLPQVKNKGQSEGPQEDILEDEEIALHGGQL